MNRNSQLLALINRIETEAATLAAKSERMKLAKNQHEAYVMRILSARREQNGGLEPLCRGVDAAVNTDPWLLTPFAAMPPLDSRPLAMPFPAYLPTYWPPYASTGQVLKQVPSTSDTLNDVVDLPPAAPYLPLAEQTGTELPVVTADEAVAACPVPPAENLPVDQVEESPVVLPDEEGRQELNVEEPHHSLALEMNEIVAEEHVGVLPEEKNVAIGITRQEEPVPDNLDDSASDAPKCDDKALENIPSDIPNILSEQDAASNEISPGHESLMKLDSDIDIFDVDVPKTTAGTGYHNLLFPSEKMEEPERQSELSETEDDIENQVAVSVTPVSPNAVPRKAAVESDLESEDDDEVLSPPAFRPSVTNKDAIDSKTKPKSRLATIPLDSESESFDLSAPQRATAEDSDPDDSFY